MKNRSLFVHFTKEEHAFVERAFDWVRKAQAHDIVTTPFLDPRERDILESLVNRERDLLVQSQGGAPHAERQRVVLAPDYVVDIPMEKFGLTCFRVFTESESELKHPDVLGALLGLGIRRDKLGDIYPTKEGADLVVASELKEFFLTELQKIGRERIRIEEIEMDELSKQLEETEEKSVTVSSLRIDVVLSAAHRLSRTLSTNMIKSGKAKLNWRIVEDPSTLVNEGDMLSLRQYGRTRISAICGNTKKGRIILKISSFN